MRQAKSIFKWLLYNGLWVATGWAGYEQGMLWCENLFVFYTWFMMFMAIVAFVTLAFLKHAITNTSFSGDALAKFNDGIRGQWQMPYLFNFSLDVFVTGYLASKGFFVLATVVVITMVSQYIARIILKELKELAIQAHANDMLRYNGEAETQTRVTEEVFRGDDDLFRMGITRTPPPPSDD